MWVAPGWVAVVRSVGPSTQLLQRWLPRNWPGNCPQTQRSKQQWEELRWCVYPANTMAMSSVATNTRTQAALGGQDWVGGDRSATVTITVISAGPGPLLNTGFDTLGFGGVADSLLLLGLFFLLVGRRRSRKDEDLVQS